MNAIICDGCRKSVPIADLEKPEQVKAGTELADWFSVTKESTPRQITANVFLADYRLHFCSHRCAASWFLEAAGRLGELSPGFVMRVTQELGPRGDGVTGL